MSVGGIVVSYTCNCSITQEIGIKGGETSKDGLFTLLEVECLGSCANAPMLQLNDYYYECLSPDSIRQLLKACKAGNPPPMQKASERVVF